MENRRSLLYEHLCQDRGGVPIVILTRQQMGVLQKEEINIAGLKAHLHSALSRTRKVLFLDVIELHLSLFQIGQ